MGCVFPALKENGLAHSGKPSFAETMQQSIPSTNNSIKDNRIIFNNLLKCNLVLDFVSRVKFLEFNLKHLQMLKKIRELTK